jgi:hypothetical protein
MAMTIVETTCLVTAASAVSDARSRALTRSPMPAVGASLIGTALPAGAVNTRSVVVISVFNHAATTKNGAETSASANRLIEITSRA